MRLILFLTVWGIEYLVKCPFYKVQGLSEGKMDKFVAKKKNIAIRTPYKHISKYFSPNTMDEILVYFYKV